jgi:hypothetical protein
VSLKCNLEVDTMLPIVLLYCRLLLLEADQARIGVERV